MTGKTKSERIEILEERVANLEDVVRQMCINLHLCGVKPPEVKP